MDETARARVEEVLGADALDPVHLLAFGSDVRAAVGWVAVDLVSLLKRHVIWEGADGSWYRDLGLDIFRHSVVENEQVSARITSSFIAIINRERQANILFPQATQADSSVRRNGDVVARRLLRSLVGLLQTLSSQSHSSLFVTPFLASSRKYYHNEGVRLAATLEPSTYLRKIDQRLEEEGERCDAVLGAALKGIILRVVLEEMVLGHVEAIVEKGELAQASAMAELRR